MVKTIQIGERQISVESNAATAHRFKQVFQTDLLKAFAGLDSVDDVEKIDALDLIQKLTYVMNRQAEKKIKEANDADYIEWLERFEESDFQDENTIKEILKTWNKNMQTTSAPKNDQSPQ